MAKQKQKKDNGRPVTLQDIADRCGVSRITASCAMRGDRKSVSQAVMDRIVQTARTMGYDPSRTLAARRLKYQHSQQQVENHLVALLSFPVFSERYWTLIFQGINRVLQAEHYGLLLCTVDDGDADVHSSLPYVFRRGDVDGVLMFTHENCAQLMRGLNDEPGFGSRPIITILDRAQGCSSVMVDDHQIGGLAAGHLLDMGHRHLVCFHQPDYKSAILRRRVEGHEQALRDRGLDPARYLHHAPWVWDDVRGLEAALTDMLGAFPQATALMCPNDNVGIQVARALVRIGRHIPGDLSVMGVDDSDEWLAKEDHNIWTTVRLPLRELGEESARLLLRQIRGEAANETTMTLPVELIVRGSTCPPR